MTFSAGRAARAQVQYPFAEILSCADSRVSPELAFDEELGQLYRGAGGGQLRQPRPAGIARVGVRYALGSRPGLTATPFSSRRSFARSSSVACCVVNAAPTGWPLPSARSRALRSCSIARAVASLTAAFSGGGRARLRACLAGCSMTSRSAARRLIAAGVPEQTAMAILGHKTRSIFQRYNIVANNDVAAATAKLAALEPHGQVIRVKGTDVNAITNVLHTLSPGGLVRLAGDLAKIQRLINIRQAAGLS